LSCTGISSRLHVASALQPMVSPQALAESLTHVLTHTMAGKLLMVVCCLSGAKDVYTKLPKGAKKKIYEKYM